MSNVSVLWKTTPEKEQWFETEFPLINELFVILCIDSFFNIRFDYDFTGLAL